MQESTAEIIKRFREQLKKDNDSANENSYGDLSKLNYNEAEMKEYKQKIDEYRNSNNEMENQYQRFHNVYKKISEKELEEKNCINREDVKVYIKRAYCPNCGAELISKTPVIFNPYTLEKIAKYDCECGFKANLEYAYPRIVYTDKDGNEIKAFGE